MVPKCQSGMSMIDHHRQWSRQLDWPMTLNHVSIQSFWLGNPNINLLFDWLCMAHGPYPSYFFHGKPVTLTVWNSFRCCVKYFSLKLFFCAQHSCIDTCQIRMWFKVYKNYFCKIKNFTNGEKIDKQSFNKPKPWPVRIYGQAMGCLL